MVVLREGLDPLTCSVPLPSTLPFLHGTPTSRRFLFGRAKSLHRPSSVTPPFPRPNYKRVEMIFLFPRRLGTEIGV